MVIGFIGSFAAVCYEPRQDRKVAAVVVTTCAEDVLMKSFLIVKFLLILSANLIKKTLAKF